MSYNKRQLYNHKLLKLLESLVEKYPEVRFTQLLSILEIHSSEFYEESIKTYSKAYPKSKDL